jgi:hypothetical protein
VFRVLALWGMTSICAWTAQESVDNPEYKAWASFKAGSFATLFEVQETPSCSLETETTVTLVALNADRALIAVKTRRSTNAAGEDPPDTEEREIPALVPWGRLSPSNKDGIEEISVAGRSFLCHWREEENEQRRIRTWTAAGVPGGVVRKITTERGPERTLTIQELIRWKIAP